MKMRKSYWILLVLFNLSLTIFSCAASAQSGKVPPFRITQSNGKVFNARDLPLGKPILLIYFSPDCEHCQVFMKAFFKRANDFKKASC